VDDVMRPLCRVHLVGAPLGSLFVRRWSSHPDARWGIWRQETLTMAALLYETADDMLSAQEARRTKDARTQGTAHRPAHGCGA
jgi:hypothetical protein